ncbi:chemotaxis protein CheA [Plastoroseomonas hellenica]|uniref:chemotaxis protein CheA n=1 Tax=Plastoroseomonas hellenica TaxID=2687306 RepID=UPI001BA92FC3|nr:chemotaxis protein CheA [Plastoroseomonas hellenica]
MSQELMIQFLVEGRELVAEASRDLAMLIATPDDVAALDGCFRAIHTLKGSTGLFDLHPMGTMLHAAEELLAAIRAGRPGHAEDFARVLDAVDQVDRWLDALEGDGALPADADAAGRAIQARIRDAAPALDQAEAQLPAVADWQLSAAFTGLSGTAIRYTPRVDCYFAGDDPVAIVAAMPQLIALSIAPRDAWGELEHYDPFACNLVIEAVSAAPRGEIEAAFRLVADQVELAELTAAEPGAPAGGMTTRRTLRVDAARIDHLGMLADELVTAKNGLVDLAVAAEALSGGHTLGQALRGRQAQLDRLVGDLHAAVGKVRLAPLAPLFARFPRLARETARALGKSVRLELEGQEIEVDKTVVDGLFDPLLHVLRNALDHGVEPAERRRAAGKPEAGLIRLTARAAGDQVVIEVADDGAGIDPARIRNLAVARGVLARDAADALDDREAVDLIFVPGFSTAATVNAVSGRGVGMDVVRAAAARLGGKVTLSGEPGRGTTVRFVLPMSMVMTKLMVVTCGGERYGLALDSVVETARVAANRLVAMRSSQAFQFRDQVVPLVILRELVGAGSQGARAPRGDAERVVIARVSGELVGFAVDAIVGRMDAALRPLDGLLSGAPGLAGSTLMPDGSVLLVLDLAELLS